MKRNFCVWKKIVVRLIHLVLVLFVTGNLFIQENSDLHKALFNRNYSYVSCYVSLAYASILFYFLTCLLDPGYVKRDENDSVNNQQVSSNSDVLLRYCDVCNLVQPIRSRHCSDCKRCIKKFDHHCVWLATCVGEKNHRYFWLFLLTTETLIAWSLIISWKAIRQSDSIGHWLGFNLIYVININILFISFMACISLLIMHTYFLINNTTTWEQFSRRNITYLRSIKDAKLNPFHESYFRNILQFFCLCKPVKWETVYTRFKNRNQSRVNDDDSDSEHETRPMEVEISSD